MKKLLSVSATILLAMMVMVCLTSLLSNVMMLVDYLENSAQNDNRAEYNYILYQCISVLVFSILLVVSFTLLAIAVQIKSNMIAIAGTGLALVQLILGTISDIIAENLAKKITYLTYNSQPIATAIVLAFVYITTILFLIFHKRITLTPVKAIVSAVPGLLYTVYLTLYILGNMSRYSAEIPIEHQDNYMFFLYVISPLFYLIPKVISFYLITYAFAFDDTKESESTEAIEQKYKDDLPVYPASPVYAPVPAAPVFDTREELKKIQSLYMEQLISDREYEEKRKQLLGI